LGQSNQARSWCLPSHTCGFALRSRSLPGLVDVIARGALGAPLEARLVPVQVAMEVPHVQARVRHSSSQYDFVKVRVWLGEGEDRHATVLSRFLLVRTLTAAKVHTQRCAAPLQRLR